MHKKIVTLIAAVGLFSSGVFAGGAFQEISVSFDAVKKIVIFGQDRTPADAKPFIYNSNVYVPLRYVSEQLKVPVTWDGVTGTVYLGESAVRKTEGAVSLFNQPLSSTFKANLYRIDNRLDGGFNVDRDGGISLPQTFVMRLMQDPDRVKATAYNSGMALKVYEGNTGLYYSLGGKYKSIKGIVGFDSEMNGKMYKTAKLRLYGDEKLISEVALNAENQFGNISADITGVQTLRVDLLTEDNAYEPIINMVNMILE